MDLLEGSPWLVVLVDQHQPLELIVISDLKSFIDDCNAVRDIVDELPEILHLGFSLHLGFVVVSRQDDNLKHHDEEALGGANQ